jgi:hypothetical protein
MFSLIVHGYIGIIYNFAWFIGKISVKTVTNTFLKTELHKMTKMRNIFFLNKDRNVDIFTLNLINVWMSHLRQVQSTDLYVPELGLKFSLIFKKIFLKF